MCSQDGSNYTSPTTTEYQMDEFFRDSLSSLGDTAAILSRFEPRTFLCVGCSKGIGRANVCHFAGRDGTEQIISLAQTLTLVPLRCPSGNSKIKNILYDIAKERRGRLTEILRREGIETIDLVLMSAGRDMPGPMRIMDADDFDWYFRNMVSGHHAVWLEARQYLSPDFAVVMGISSLSAETRVIPRKGVYRIVKQALADLILEYAIEEAYEQPNTHYAVIYQGIAATSGGLKQILPESVSLACKAALRGAGMFMNVFMNQEGMEPTDVARQYHKIYATIAGYKYLNETNGAISRGAVPTTFTVESADTSFPFRTIQYNHRMLPPGMVYDCYAPYWENFNGEQVVPVPEWHGDPRLTPQLCPATGPQSCLDAFNCDRLLGSGFIMHRIVLNFCIERCRTISAFDLAGWKCGPCP
jgi:NAD(P)-dependent dehydrogenase (short-subunit alcohol dehydrogenase family)